MGGHGCYFPDGVAIIFCFYLAGGFNPSECICSKCGIIKYIYTYIRISFHLLEVAEEEEEEKIVMGGSGNEERRRKDGTAAVYKTKVVHVLGRSIPIILQNDNGPCPLLAISNVLLLRNIINLSPDTTEISLQRLLSLVAGRLLDSNSNIENKDAGYVQNQQQNIADAIDLLPCLATGIDVNVRFRHIHDFEFTRECAIFDLLDIGLVHGWIFDPQDKETARVIGSHSYNTLMEKLVALDASKTQELPPRVADEDSIDFAAATTATLGVPSPSLSRGKSFEDSPVSTPSDCRGRRGDEQEVEELMKALDLSKVDLVDGAPPDIDSSLSAISYQNPNSERPPCQSLPELSENNIEDADHASHMDEASKLDGDIVAAISKSRVASFSCLNQLNILPGNVPGETPIEELLVGRTEGENESSVKDKDKVAAENAVLDAQFLFPQSSNVSPELYTDPCTAEEASKSQQVVARSSCQETSTSIVHCGQVEGRGEQEYTVYTNAFSCGVVPLSDNKGEPIESSEDVSSSLEGSEPIYEGEECILDPAPLMYESREPLYEGEMVLAEQADKGTVLQGIGLGSRDEISLQEQEESLSAADREGALIRNFLRNNASQLTVYGLFCLQEGLKERELCVFFRNNHFSTMFKFKGDLYLLATDQGYINQPDLVWEKLNEVHGDSVFMTGDFKEFKAEDQVGSSWNQHHAVAKTADYIASVTNTQPSDATLNSDLQLAIALQQQEFEQQQPQQQQQQQQHLQYPRTTQSSVPASSKMVTGPEVTKPSSSTSKQESKSKERCVVM